jgi:hypothetical protein
VTGGDVTSKESPKPSIDVGYPTPADGPVPAFNSIERGAGFWDTHDTTDFSLLTPFDFLDDSEIKRALVVLLEPNDRDEFDRRAEELGIELATLVRMWIEERLRKEAS